jgi:hypothetical protein
VLIQFVLLSAVVVLLAVFMRSWNTTRTRAWKRIAFLAFCFVNAYAVLRPGDTTRAATCSASAAAPTWCCTCWWSA